MIVMMRHRDQRHVFGQTELFCQNLRRARHLVEPAAVEARGLRRAQQPKALRRFLQYRAAERAGERRIIPRGQPGEDVADVASHAAQGLDHRLDRFLRILRRVLVAGKTLLLIVEDQARARSLRHFHQGDAGIVRAGCAKPRKVERVAARECFTRQSEPCVRVVRPQLVEARVRHGLRGEPARQAKAGSAKSRMSRANPFLFHLAGSINHK